MNELNLLRKEKENLRNDLAKMEASLQKSSLRVQELEDQIFHIQLQKSFDLDLDKKIKEIEEEKEALRSSKNFDFYQEREKNFLDQIQRLQDENQNLLSNVEVLKPLQTQLVKIKEELVFKITENQALQSEINHLKVNLNNALELQASLETKKEKEEISSSEERSKLVAEITILKENHENNQKTINTLKKKIEELSALLNIEKHKQNLLQQNLNISVEKLNEFTMAYDALRRKFESANPTNQSLRTNKGPGSEVTESDSIKPEETHVEKDEIQRMLSQQGSNPSDQQKKIPTEEPLLELQNQELSNPN